MTREDGKVLAHFGTVNGESIDSRSIVKQESGATVPRPLSFGAVCCMGQRAFGGNGKV
jgi:hypothetical protein